VSPSLYRMCFPLKITKWWHNFSWKYFKCFRKGNKRPFITFDGCAQYLTSPTAPYLIAEAYRMANQHPPVLVACVRNPVDQAISWWKYENNAILWGEGMGLVENNIVLRSKEYPPVTIGKALDFSQSEYVSETYAQAERVIVSLINDVTTGKMKHVKLPPWAITWPCGQLGSFGRSGNYATNIQRYERVFSNKFRYNEYCPTREKKREDKTLEKLKYITVVPFKKIIDVKSSNFVLESILTKAAMRQSKEDMVAFKDAIRIHFSMHKGTNVHRNSSSSFSNMNEPTLIDKQKLEACFSDSKRNLEKLCGDVISW